MVFPLSLSGGCCGIPVVGRGGGGRGIPMVGAALPVGNKYHDPGPWFSRTLLSLRDVARYGASLVLLRHALGFPPLPQWPPISGEWGRCPNAAWGVVPKGPREAYKCREAKIAARHFLPLNCRALTLTAGAILKKEKKLSFSLEEGQFRRHFKRQFGRG